MSRSHVTIRELANASGYSTATVSKALRHHPAVPESTREKIQKVADELGYRPHAMIRALMSQVRNAKGVKASAIPLALLNPWGKSLDEQSSFTTGIVKGCKDRAEELGYRVDVFDLKAYSNKRLDDVLQARGIQGLLIPPHGQHSCPFAPELGSLCDRGAGRVFTAQALASKGNA